MALEIQILCIFLFLFFIGTLALLSLEINKVKKDMAISVKLLIEESKRRDLIINILEEMMHKQLDLQKVNNALLSFHNSVMSLIEQSSAKKSKKVAEKSRKPKNESPSKTINPVTARANGNKKTSTIKTKKIVAKGKK